MNMVLVNVSHFIFVIIKERPWCQYQSTPSKNDQNLFIILRVITSPKFLFALDSMRGVWV